MNALDALAVANAEFARRLELVSGDDWTRPTPCDEWDVRALVNHVIGGNRRHRMLLDGATAADTDAIRGTDHIDGGDAISSFTSTAVSLVDAFRSDGAMRRVVQHSAGARTGAQLLNMRALDVAIHTWDLARAIGADEALDPQLVAWALQVDADPSGSTSAVAPAGSSAQGDLLRRTGRDPHEAHCAGTARDEFLAAILPRLTAAESALHSGDAAPRVALWSHEEPVTVFGAAITTQGWEDVERTFNFLASRFADCRSFKYDVIAADVSGDLAYIVGIEHTSARVGEIPSKYSLRVTTILRRENGTWRIVHRHGDPYDLASGAAVARLGA